MQYASAAPPTVYRILNRLDINKKAPAFLQALIFFQGKEFKLHLRVLESGDNSHPESIDFNQWQSINNSHRRIHELYIPLLI